MTNLDLIARLRDKAANGGVIPIHDVTLEKAADEIERLQGKNAELRRALMSCRAQWIHSVNAKRCLEALDIYPYDPAVMAEARGDNPSSDQP